MPILLIAFIIVPLAELAVIVRVSHAIGLAATIAVLLLVSVLGAWLTKREGLGVISRFRSQMSTGTVPTTEIVDGVLVVVAGALLLTPGFITDATGLALLMPPVRAAVRSMLRKAVAKRLRLGKVGRFRNIVSESRDPRLPPK